MRQVNIEETRLVCRDPNDKSPGTISFRCNVINFPGNRIACEGIPKKGDEFCSNGFPQSIPEGG
jgi:hypothetical protein